jgi:hypothetical protein
MGKVIRGCRKGKGGIFKSHTKNRLGAVKLRNLDFAERQGFIKGVVKSVSKGDSVVLLSCEFFCSSVLLVALIKWVS